MPMRALEEGWRGVIASAAPADARDAVRSLDAASRMDATFELRADRLGLEDVTRLVRRATVPVIVTVRRPEDGGMFRRSEDHRRRILEAALAAGAACIDVEENGSLASWATGLPPERVILSHHGARCLLSELHALATRMRAHPAARLKIVPHVERPADGAAIHDLLAAPDSRRKPLAAFGGGAAGIATRVLALSWGSWATYGAVEDAGPTAPAQPSASDLLSTYRVHRIGSRTARYGLVGRPVLRSPSPHLYAAAFAAVDLDAVYLPLETESLGDALALADSTSPFSFAGFGVTIPYKEDAAAAAARRDPFVERCGAANTLRRDVDGLSAFNTDGPALLDLAVREAMQPEASVAILGAGGTARAAALAFRNAGARVVLFNRTPSRAETAAAAVGVSWLPRGDLGAFRWDVLVQATPLGRGGEDALPERRFPGLVVVDAAYGAQPTPLVTHAREAGLRVHDGIDVLAAQAQEQFRILTGAPIPCEIFAAAAKRIRGSPP